MSLSTRMTRRRFIVDKRRWRRYSAPNGYRRQGGIRTPNNCDIRIGRRRVFEPCQTRKGDRSSTASRSICRQIPHGPAKSEDTVTNRALASLPEATPEGRRRLAHWHILWPIRTIQNRRNRGLSHFAEMALQETLEHRWDPYNHENVGAMVAARGYAPRDYTNELGVIDPATRQRQNVRRLPQRARSRLAPAFWRGPSQLRRVEGPPMITRALTPSNASHDRARPNTSRRDCSRNRRRAGRSLNLHPSSDWDVLWRFFSKDVAVSDQYFGA